MTKRWTFITKAENGNKFFLDNETGKVAVVDISEDTPEQSKDAILYIDETRKCNAFHWDMLDRDLCAIPVVDERDEMSIVLSPLHKTDWRTLKNYVNLDFTDYLKGKLLVFDDLIKSNESFYEQFEEIMNNFSEHFDAEFRDSFDYLYPNNIPGLQDCGASELLYQVNPRDYIEIREDWADNYPNKSQMALVKACQETDLDAQDVLDELVYDTCAYMASQEINSQPIGMEETMHKRHEKIASDVNNGGIVAQVEYLIKNGWQVKDIVLKVSELVDDQASPGMGR